jgi:hypothetical protein
MKIVYSNQSLYSDLLIILQTVDNLNHSDTQKTLNILDSLAVRFYNTSRDIQSKVLKSKTKAIAELIRTIIYLSNSKKKILVLKKNLHELLFLVQSEIEKEVQLDLFKEVA